MVVNLCYDAADVVRLVIPQNFKYNTSGKTLSKKI